MATSLNPNLENMKSDYLYHLGYSKDDIKTTQVFKDVRFVVTGGCPKRMAQFAELIAKRIGHHTSELKELDMTTKPSRFSFYKIGPVIAVNHGMGVPSLTILLHEIIKLLHYAEAKDPIIIRIGTSGGLDIPPGSLVVTNRSVNAFLKEEHQIIVMGKPVIRPAIMDKDLAEEIKKCQKDNSYKTVLGTTMCTDDFYEGQARTDGAFCYISEEERLQYLREISGKGVRNIEMEATAISSLCSQAAYRSAIICVALLDRLKGDQVDIPPEVYAQYTARPLDLAAQFICDKIQGAKQN